MLVVQVVEILWTKETRGAPRSNARAALPRAFAVGGVNEEYFVQHHRMAEWEGFSPFLVRAEAKPSAPSSEEVLRIAHAAEGNYVIGFLGTPHSGQPRRGAMPNALELGPGEYVRVTVNARHTTYSGQYYTETVYNIACGEAVASNRFLSSSPDRELDLKANLF